MVRLGSELGPEYDQPCQLLYNALNILGSNGAIIRDNSQSWNSAVVLEFGICPLDWPIITII